jgi:PelA/Pel-15E family pectate lyase
MNRIIIPGKKYFLLLFLILPFIYTCSQNNSVQKEYDAIDVSPFENSAHHWYDITAEDNIIEPKKNQSRYRQNQIEEIAGNILLYQKNNGGWPKNYDILAVLTEEQKDSLIDAKNILNTTFDNGTTHTHVDYLAKAFTKAKVERFKEACINGIDFILSAQYPNGGWPQFYPDTNGYAKYITFNDGVFTGIMKVLKNICDGDSNYSFLDKDRKERIKTAYAKGLECILKCQINDNGRLTVWGQQHDNVTLKPQWARTFEPPGICNGESSDVILFLMSIDNPNKDAINSIQSAVKWVDDSKIKGIRIETKRVAPVKYKWSTFDFDRFVVEDPDAPPIWARYYELGTDKPLFCNRDGKVVYSLADVLHERRAGYSWYTYEPQEVLNKYSDWQKKWASDKNVLIQ